VIFPQAGVLTPVESIFDACPVISDMLKPAVEGGSLRKPVGQVISVFRKGLSLTGAGVADTQRAAGMREVQLGRFDIDAANSPRFMATMGFADDLRKKGEAAVRCTRRALRVG
jgi:hypothetical protein